MSEPTPETPSQTNGLRWVFFSPSDGRLRSGWRLLLHAIIFVLFSSIITGGFLVLSGDTILSNLRDPMVMLGISAGGSLPAAAVATWLASKYLDKRPMIELGLDIDDHLVSDLVVGFLIPAPLFGLIFSVELAAGWLTLSDTPRAVPISSAAQATVFILAAFIAVGIYEELIFRGYQLINLAEALPLRWALLIVSALFALAHSANPGASVNSAAGIFFAGYFLAYGWLRTGQLWLPIGLHIGWNFFQGPIFGFPVSGLEGFRLLRHQIDGPQLLTGGRFGPEAGLLGYFAMAVGAALIWSYTKDRDRPLQSEDGSEPDRRPIDRGD